MAPRRVQLLQLQYHPSNHNPLNPPNPPLCSASLADPIPPLPRVSLAPPSRVSFTMADKVDEVQSVPDLRGSEGQPPQASAMSDIIRNAKAAADKEQKMTLLQGIRLYPKAIAWSMLISTCIIMEGYDIVLVNNFYALPQFNRVFGEQLPDDSWQVPAPWQSGLSNGVVVGEIIGLLLNGWISERIGYRYTSIGCLVSLTGLIALFFTTNTVQQLLAAEILCGIPWGVFQTLAINYASEVCPIALRGYLTTYINCCWGIGQLIGIGTIMGNRWRDDEWAFRIVGQAPFSSYFISLYRPVNFLSNT